MSYASHIYLDDMSCSLQALRRYSMHKFDLTCCYICQEIAIYNRFSSWCQSCYHWFKDIENV